LLLTPIVTPPAIVRFDGSVLLSDFHWRHNGPHHCPRFDVTQSNIPVQRDHLGKPLHGWRLKLYTIIFEADTRAGQWFDRWLIALILASVAVVMADSVPSLGARFSHILGTLEWIFTILFTLEYLARLACVRHPARYARSFFGVVDLLSVLPTYLALLLPGAHVLADVRVLRLLRIFRIFKLTAYVSEYQTLVSALVASRRKIMVFLSVVLMIVLIMGTLMYLVEGPEHGFSSIPTSVYWAITTMTTVGFGDITPRTDLGRMIASLMMLLGWGTLAVPTGIVTSEMTAQRQSRAITTRTCHECLTEGHSPEARHCLHCGAKLPPYQHHS
jgi:voltage-gated potassium channel